MNKLTNFGQSDVLKNSSIMADFKLLSTVTHKKVGWMELKFCMALVTISLDNFAFGLFILAFVISAIIHQQLLPCYGGTSENRLQSFLIKKVNLPHYSFHSILSKLKIKIEAERVHGAHIIHEENIFSDFQNISRNVNRALS